MKKTVKSLIVAASVAAVAGIGAVSFAKWTGGSGSYTPTDNLTSGTVTAVGFAASPTTENLSKALMPIDQASVTDEQTYYYGIKLTTEGTDFTGYKITATPSAGSGSAVPSGLKIKINKGEALTVGKDTNISGWTDINTAGTAVDLYTQTIGTDEDYYVYIALDSDNSTYGANAGKTFNVTIELTKPAST